MKSNLLVGYIAYAIAFVILVFLISQGYFIPSQDIFLNLSLAVAAFILLGVGYFLRRKSRKSETN
jgi:membrane protein DedA with SNARE-associated domain